MPPEVERIARKYLRHPVVIKIGDETSGACVMLPPLFIVFTLPNHLYNTPFTLRYFLYLLWVPFLTPYITLPLLYLNTLSTLLTIIPSLPPLSTPPFLS